MTVRLTSHRVPSEKGTKMNWMLRLGRLGLATLALGVSGCARTPATLPISSSSESVTVGQLPDVPSCEHVKTAGAVHAVTIEGQPDLYLVIQGGSPLCIDDRAGLTALKTRNQANVNWSAIDIPGGEADSDPMPCRSPETVSSDPMPAHPPGEVGPPENTGPIGH